MKPDPTNALAVINMTALFRTVWKINIEMLLHGTVVSSVELIEGNEMKSTTHLLRTECRTTENMSI